MTNSLSGIVRLLPSIIAMGGVILLSNILVQIPVQHVVGGFDLADLLTWGAFSYPIAFLVTDTTNRLYGAQSARKVVYFGFVLGVVLSLAAAFGIAAEVAVAQGTNLFETLMTDEDASGMLRIAIASGTAFFIGQMLDIIIFDKLRASTWWKAPTVSSFFGSATDTIIFFGLAFGGTGLPWASWAAGDFTAKLVMVALLLYPFKWIISIFPSNTKAA